MRDNADALKILMEHKDSLRKEFKEDLLEAHKSLEEGFSGIHKTVKEINETTKEIHTQALLTNGRVNTLYKLRESENLNERVSNNEQWRWKAIGAGGLLMVIISTAGYGIFTLGMKDVVRKEFQIYKKEQSITFVQDVERVIEGYEFELTTD